MKLQIEELTDRGVVLARTPYFGCIDARKGISKILRDVKERGEREHGPLLPFIWGRKGKGDFQIF